MIRVIQKQRKKIEILEVKVKEKMERMSPLDRDRPIVFCLLLLLTGEFFYIVALTKYERSSVIAIMIGASIAIVFGIAANLYPYDGNRDIFLWMHLLSVILLCTGTICKFVATIFIIIKMSKIPNHTPLIVCMVIEPLLAVATIWMYNYQSKKYRETNITEHNPNLVY